MYFLLFGVSKNFRPSGDFCPSNNAFRVSLIIAVLPYCLAHAGFLGFQCICTKTFALKGGTADTIFACKKNTAKIHYFEIGDANGEGTQIAKSR